MFCPRSFGLSVYLSVSKITQNILNKNLAIANRSRVSYAHNMSRASMITP